MPIARKLIAGGCSYTDAEYITSDKDLPQVKGNWTMWPEIFGEKLGLDVINTGRSGAGNEQIVHDVKEQCLKHKGSIDTVAILWSEFDRMRFFGLINFGMMAETMIHMGQNPAFEGAFVGIPHRKRMGIDGFAYNYFKSEQFPIQRYGYIKGVLQDSFRRILDMADYCKANDIKFIFASGCTHFQWKTLNRLSVQMPFAKQSITNLNEFIKLYMNNVWFTELEKEYKKHIIGWPFEPQLNGFSFDNLRYMGKKPFTFQKNGYNVSPIDNHPNEECQTLFAEIFLTEYRKLYG